MSNRIHLFTDADNTLWDTNAVYAEAQLALLRDMEVSTGISTPATPDRRLAFLRDLDQRIAANHPDHLRYPAHLLALGLEFALKGESPDRAVTRSLDLSPHSAERFTDLMQRYFERLNRPPNLRRGVRAGLTTIAAARIPISVVTEQHLERCLEILQVHSLRSSVGDVISLTKTLDAFCKLKSASDADRVVMVGDQLDRDIVTASGAGFETFYYPGGFRPYWAEKVDAGRTHVISSYDEIVPFLVGPGLVENAL